MFGRYTWRRWVANSLLQLARWLNPTWEQDWYGIDPHVQLMANEQVARFSTMPGVSNEYRRNEAYTYVVKRFPAHRKRSVAMAVELGVQKCG